MTSLDPDKDLEQMGLPQLLIVAKEMRAAIRVHRDASGHDLCWFQPELWALLPDRPEKRALVPPRAEFLERCVHYRDMLEGKPASLPAAEREQALRCALGKAIQRLEWLLEMADEIIVDDEEIKRDEMDFIAEMREVLEASR